MKTKRIFIALAALVFAAMGYGQVVVNSEGNFCVGNDSCFWGFDGATASHLMSPRWTNVNSATLNVGGGLSIAALGTAWAFTVSKPYKSALGKSISPFFYINGNGTVYSMNGIIQSSDSTLKSNITVLTSALPKIKRLKGVSYNFKVEGESFGQANSPSSLKQANNKAPHKRIGLLAQDVEKVYPEVVYNLNDSTKGIAYADLVAVLVEGIKELDDSLTVVSDRYALLQEQIKDLQMQIENMRAAYSPEKEKNEKNKSGNASKMFPEAVLYQNTPNPFNQETEIAYRIPSGVTASINIYNLNGLELNSYPLTDTNGSITIAASELAAGIYIYSLIINNREVDSKRMILTH